MNTEVKRYIISSAITFLSAFLLVVGSDLGNLDAETLSYGALLGILIAGVRVGVKAIAESFLAK